MDYKEIKSLSPKGNHPEYSLEGLMLKLNLKNFGCRLTGKELDAGKDRGQEENGETG